MGQGDSKADQKKAEDSKKLTANQHCTVIDNPGRIQEFYDIDRRRLGEGSFATVFRGCNKSTGFERAIKVCSKSGNKNRVMFLEEIHIMKHVDHPNIIKYYESFQDTKYIYIVMQICKGPEVFDLIATTGHLTEMVTAKLMQQVFRAVTYMHSAHVIHRDLKTENFMLYNDDCEDEDNTIKILDFGLAALYEIDAETGEAEMLTRKCGAPFYVAPQVIAGSYNYMADVWSCGVLMYTMLAGYPPFFGESDADVLAKVRLGNYHFNQADFKSITKDAKDLMRGLMKINPCDRLDSMQALDHPWMHKFCPRTNELPLKNSLIYYLRNFGQSNRLKRAALYVIAGTLTDDELKPAVDSFNMMDVEGDGNLGFEEIYNGLKRAGIKDIPHDLKKILADMDSDGSGQVEFTEFLSATIDKKYITEDNVWSAFRVFDQNGDGKISQMEMYRVLNQRCDEGEEAVNAQEVIALMAELSEDGDTYVDFPEFFNMMRNNACLDQHLNKGHCALTARRSMQKKTKDLRETPIEKE